MGKNSQWLLGKIITLAVLAAAAIAVLAPWTPAPLKVAAVLFAVLAQAWFAGGNPFVLKLPQMGAQAGGAYLDNAAMNAALKEWYDDQKVETLAYERNVTLVLIPKKTNATGKYIPIPVVYEVSQGASNTFTNAQGNQTPGLLAEFLLPLRADYSLATISNQAMEASADDRGSFLEGEKLLIDLAIRSCANRTSVELFRSGTGTRGRIGTITAGVIVLSNPADISNFGINQTLQANSTDGGAPRATLGYVIARDVAAGTITVSATTWGGAAGTPTNWAANDYLLVQGDLNSGMTGYAGWLPSTAPSTTDNFYGVNRSVDSRLYGLYYNGARQQIEEAIIDQLQLVMREGGDPRHWITNNGSIAALIKALGTRREYVDLASEDGTIGFRGVKVQGPQGPVDCFADRSCQPRTGYALQMNTWKLYSLGPVPRILKYGDKLEMLRVNNADASEVRVGRYSNPGCNAPGWNSQVALGA